MDTEQKTCKYLSLHSNYCYCTLWYTCPQFRLQTVWALKACRNTGRLTWRFRAVELPSLNFWQPLNGLIKLKDCVLKVSYGYNTKRGWDELSVRLNNRKLSCAAQLSRRWTLHCVSWAQGQATKRRQLYSCLLLEAVFLYFQKSTIQFASNVSESGYVCLSEPQHIRTISTKNPGWMQPPSQPQGEQQGAPCRDHPYVPPCGLELGLG